MDEIVDGHRVDETVDGHWMKGNRWMLSVACRTATCQLRTGLERVYLCLLDESSPVRRSAFQVLAVFVVLAVGLAPATASGATGPRPADQTPDGIEVIYQNAEIVRTSGGADVDVAILDTGVDASHPDLLARVELCRDYTNGGVEEETCVDENGHGTRVAGIVAANGGPDGDGLYGVAPEADLYAFKVCQSDGRCRTDRMATAIRDAVDEGAEVIVVSIGGRQTASVRGAIRYAHENGALIVAAAGNSGPSLDSMDYPAADELVVGVGAVTRSGVDLSDPDNYEVARFSSRGLDSIGTEFDERDGVVDLAAPGVTVLSTVPGGGYGHDSGTSFAAPHIGGLAAKLWWTVDDADGDGHRNDEVRAELHRRAFDVTGGEFAGRGYDPAAGTGVPTVLALRPTFEANLTTPTIGDAVTFTAGFSRAPDNEVLSFEWDFDDDGGVDARGRTVTTHFETPGNRTVSLTVVDETGQTVRTTATFRVNAPPEFTVTLPDAIDAGERVALEAVVVDDSASVTVTWEFPDGTTKQGTTVRTRFQGGSQQVEVVARDSDGAVTRMTVEVAVTTPTPTATRTPSPTAPSPASPSPVSPSPTPPAHSNAPTQSPIAITGPGLGLVGVTLVLVGVVFALRARRRNA